jgi:predicted GNAT family acetyltransferase
MSEVVDCSKLITGALDQMRADGLKVIAHCEFVKAFFAKNAAYEDLLG